jgi:hypothetical protein
MVSPSFTLKMKVVNSYETLDDVSQSAERHVKDDCNFYSQVIMN